MQLAALHVACGMWQGDGQRVPRAEWQQLAAQKY